MSEVPGLQVRGVLLVGRRRQADDLSIFVRPLAFCRHRQLPTILAQLQTLVRRVHVHLDDAIFPNKRLVTFETLVTRYKPNTSWLNATT